MTRSNFVDFRAIKREVTMVQVLEHYGVLSQMRRSGDAIAGACPIHGGNNETAFRVSVSKNCWNCFSECGGGGNVLDFVAKKENVSVLKAANLLVEWFGLTIAASEAEETEIRKFVRGDTTKRTSPITKQKQTEPVSQSTPDSETVENKPLDFVLKNLQPEHPYLTERGLSPETINIFGLGFCTKGLHKGRIAIPIHNAKGELVAYAGRATVPETKEKYQLPKGFKKSLELFNFHRAIAENTDQPLVLVEGFFDCMKLWQHGIRRAVALMGSSMSQIQEELIREYSHPRSQMLVMLDEDAAGRAGRDDIVRKLSRSLFVKTHVFTKEGMQPDLLSADEIEHLFQEAL